MHTVEVTILEPEAEAMLDEMENKNLIKMAHEKNGGKKPLRRGSMKGLVVYISDDFDAPLEDFADYM
jgi:hypothetical protein